MRVVCNTTPIISLAGIGRIDLLSSLFGTVVIPREVYRELRRVPGPGFEEVEQSVFQVLDVQGVDYLDLLLNDLDAGEAETILLARELSADLVIIDERLGYQMARSLGLKTVGTLTILQTARTQGLIPSVKPLLDGMIANGRWYSHEVYKQFLAMIGEA